MPKLIGDRQMAEASETMRVVVKFTTEEPDAYAFAWAVQALNLALTAGVWIEAALESRGGWSSGPLASDDAASRYFTDDDLDQNARALRFVQELDPFNPLDTGLLTGLTNARREQLDQRERPHGDPYAIGSLEDVRRESPIIVVFALPIVLTAGVGVMSAASIGASAVLKNVDRVFKIKKTRAEERLIDAQRAQLQSGLAEAQADEAHAIADRARAETVEIKARTRREFVEAGVDPQLRTELMRAIGPSMARAGAGDVGVKIAEAATAELAANNAVADVEVEEG